MKTVSRSITLLAFMLAFAFATTANANEYIVYSCKTPSGAIAPTDGWSVTGGVVNSWSANNCGTGGSLSAGLFGPSQSSNAPGIGWEFDSGAPPIRGYTITRDGRINGGGYGVSMLMYSADGQNIADGAHSVDYCAVYSGCTSVGGAVTKAAAAIPWDSHKWFFSMTCGGYANQLCTHGDSVTDFGELNIRTAAFTLEDDDQPSVANVGGSLTAEGASFGAISLLASDDTSGIARAAIEVDGAEAVGEIPNSNGGHCQRVGQAGGANDYLYRRPCPARQQVELTLPRNTLINGEHVMRVRVYDAAGNGVTAFGPRRMQVSGSTVTGLTAARFSLDGPRSVIAKYGHNVRIRGTLLANTGEPLPGARIDSTFDSSSTTRARIAHTVHTDRDGRFSLTVRALANRKFTLTHADTGAQFTGGIKVQSRIKLRAAHRRIRSLGKMQLTGRIPGERAKHGASVAIKVKSGKRWRTVAVVRTTRAGAFKFNYRFSRIRHASLSFRAVALKSSDLTVSATPSRLLRVRVG